MLIRFTFLAVLLSVCAFSAHGAPPYSFSGGAAVFEAEEYGSSTARAGQEWVSIASLGGYSGTGYVEALPDIGSNIDTNWTTTSPELQYEVIFPSGGTYYVWVNAYAADSAQNSAHIGVDGNTGAASRITWTNFGAWTWTNGVADGGAASIAVTSGGSHVVSLWMREDGAKVDRILLSSNPGFKPRTANAWHIPHSSEPVNAHMRSPIFEIYPSAPVSIFSGSQYQGGGEAGNQLQGGSAILYRASTNDPWTAISMSFQGVNGNNIYYSNNIPAGALIAGSTVEYYLRLPYSDYLTTYLYQSNGVSLKTDNESVAQANPFRFAVRAPPAPLGGSPDDWRDQNIYFIFTDRFNDGHVSNNNANTQSPANLTNSRRIHGGDFKGIEKKLDYIRSLGATAIWITPIPQNVGNSGYHGYGADDFYQLQPNWGSPADLSNLSAAARAKGISLLLDVVCNHQGNRIDSTQSGWPTFSLAGYTLRWTTGTQFPPPFNNLSNFHNNGHIQNFNDPDQVLGELSGLDDIRTETLHARTNLVNIYKHWIQAGDFDGFRLDTVKHADIGIWQHFNSEIRAFARAAGKTNFFQYGEVFDGNDGKCGYYTGTKAGGAFANDAVVDYPLYFQIDGVFATAVSATKNIEDRYNNIAANYDAYAQTRLVTFIDNHDRPRFMTTASANNNTQKLAVALAFLYTGRGIPCLYYGTEQNFNGNGDPNNREDMFDGQFETGPSLGDNFNMTQGTYQHIAKLNNFRRSYEALRRGSHNNLWNNPSGPGLFAYARRLGTQEVFVVFNTASGSQTLTNRPTIHAAGTRLVNILATNEIITVTNGADGIPPVTVPSFGVKMFVAESQVKPLDPVVTAQSPAHNATNVSPLGTITLSFSKPMNTASVQQAFSLSPSVGGTFAWTTNRQQFTFTPNFPGYAGATTIVARVGTNATDGVTSNAFFAAFETYFHTAPSTNFDNVPPSVVITAPATGATVAGSTMLTGTAADNVGVQRVDFRLDAGEWFAASGTTAWAYGFDSALFLNGSHQLSARAVDASGNVSSSATVSVRFFNVPGPYEARLSAGNPADATNCDASVWALDRAFTFGGFGYSGGTNGFIANAISNVCAEAQPLYQRERYSTPAASFRYLFQCPPGMYETVLLETETFVTNVGGRVFDLYIQTDRVLTNYDILASAGGQNLPVTLAFTNAVADALLEMHFLPQVQNSRASGIHVRKVADLDTDADGLPDWWLRGWFDHPTGQEADLSRPGDDPDGDGLSNADEYLIGTDPTSPSVLPSIHLIALGGSFDVSMPSVSGRVYDLEAAASPADGTAWTAVLQNVLSSGGIISLADTNDLDGRVYRVRVRMP